MLSRVLSRVPGEHLVDEDAVGPPVDRLAVTLGQDDLGSEILGRAAQGPRPILNLRRA